MHAIIEKIFAAFEGRGRDRYGEEHVTQLQHALQSAKLAQTSGAEPALIAAALLHDIGHILPDQDLPKSCDENLDDDHETRGYLFLKEHFGDPVADPVRLHVVAKRYLCTVDPKYIAKLSPTSLKSYHDQGGTMSEEEQRQFEAEPYFRQALKLRHWDDAAKEAQMQTPDLEAYRAAMEACLSG